MADARVIVHSLLRACRRLLPRLHLSPWAACCASTVRHSNPRPTAKGPCHRGCHRSRLLPAPTYSRACFPCPRDVPCEFSAPAAARLWGGVTHVGLGKRVAVI